MAPGTVGVSPFGVGAVAGTALYTLGVSLLALRPGTTTLSRLLGRFGSLTLIAYLVHVAFIELLRPHRFAFDRPTWRLVFPFTVAILSFTFAATYYASTKSRSPLLQASIRLRRPAPSIGCAGSVGHHSYRAESRRKCGIS